MSTTAEEMVDRADDHAEPYATIPIATLDHLDPLALAANPDNVRTNLGDLGPLAASIAACGVLEPLVVIPDGDGGHRIIAGHRRNAAAIIAEQPTVPCIVRADLAATDSTASVVAMIVENTHRLDLSTPDEARAYQQLAMTGLSATKIAKQVGHKPARIKKGLAVAGSDLAVAAAERYTLSLEQAAVLAEFDGDKDAVKSLVVTAKADPGRWDHVVSRLRQDRKAEAAYAAAVQALVDAGVTVIDRPGYRDGAVTLDHLVDGDGNVLTAEGHASCPGHAAVVSEHDPDRVSYYCVDPAANGHADRWAGTSTASTAPTVLGSKMTEQAKAARQEVIEGNKSWRAAEPVRREWIRTLLARKTAPKGTLRFVVTEILGAPDRVGDGKDALLADLLHQPEPSQSWGRAVGSAAAANATEGRLPLLLLAQLAADREQTMSEHTWRHVDRGAARWFGFLASTGYSLAAIEQKVVDDAQASPDDDTDELVSDGDTDPDAA